VRGNIFFGNNGNINLNYIQKGNILSVIIIPKLFPKIYILIARLFPNYSQKSFHYSHYSQKSLDCSQFFSKLRKLQLATIIPIFPLFPKKT